MSFWRQTSSLILLFALVAILTTTLSPLRYNSAPASEINSARRHNRISACLRTSKNAINSPLPFHFKPASAFRPSQDIQKAVLHLSRLHWVLTTIAQPEAKRNSTAHILDLIWHADDIQDSLYTISSSLKGVVDRWVQLTQSLRGSSILIVW